MEARAKDNTYDAMNGSPGITMITMNMGPDGSKNEDGSIKSTAENRRIVVDLVVKHRKPDILFAQEIMAPCDPKWKLNVNDEYQFYEIEQKAGQCHKAGLMWNKNIFCCKEIDSEKNKEILQKFRKTGKWNKDSLSVIEERICAVCLQHRATQNYILAVSWHGRSKAPEHIKKESLILLQRFTLELSKKLLGTLYTQPAIIIGGDFNLDWESAEIENEYRLQAYEPTQRRLERSNKIIDYFLHTFEIKVNKIQPLILWHENQAQTFHRENFDKDILYSVDHDPIECIFSFYDLTLHYIQKLMKIVNKEKISKFFLNKKIQNPDRLQVDGEEEIKAICEVCGKDCLSYNNLISHRKIHAQTMSRNQTSSDEEEYPCPDCDMICRSEAELANHQRTHSYKIPKLSCSNQISSEKEE